MCRGEGGVERRGMARVRVGCAAHHLAQSSPHHAQHMKNGLTKEKEHRQHQATLKAAMQAPVARWRWRAAAARPANALELGQGWRARQSVASFFSSFVCASERQHHHHPVVREAAGGGAARVISTRPPCWQQSGAVPRARKGPRAWTRCAAAAEAEKWGEIVECVWFHLHACVCVCMYVGVCVCLGVAGWLAGNFI